VKFKDRSTLYTSRPKKRPQFSLRNFNKCRHSFVIFGMNHNEDSFLPRDAMQSAVMPQYVVLCRPSVCLSVTFRYRDHIGWNSSKTISRPKSVRPMCGLTPTRAIRCNGNTP